MLALVAPGPRVTKHTPGRCVIAPSGAQFYTGKLFPEWNNNLFIGSMKDRMLVRLVLENDRVKGEEHLLRDRGKRVREPDVES